MRSLKRYISFFILTASLLISAAAQAETPQGWTNEFEAKFSKSVTVEGTTFAYPKEFKAEQSVMGFWFKKVDKISGEISNGAEGIKTKEEASEWLLKDLGGKKIKEFEANGYTVFASNSIDGDLIRRTYLILPKDKNIMTLYGQFFWQQASPVDYEPMLDIMMSPVK